MIKAYKQWRLLGYKKSYDPESGFDYKVILGHVKKRTKHEIGITLYEFRAVRRTMHNKLTQPLHEPNPDDEPKGFWDYRIYCAMYNWVNK